MKALHRAEISAALLAVLAGCGTRQVLPENVALAEGTSRVAYVWQEGDTWRFLAWAVLDADSGEGSDALALMAGFLPNAAPSPGETVQLPLDPALEDALLNRMAAARLVREATASMDGGRAGQALDLLSQASALDPGWSIPVWDISLILLESGERDSVASLLEPLAGKPRAEILLARISWEEGNTSEALHHVETALAAGEPSAEVLACAALVYTITGNTYQASRLWLRILAEPSAPSALRVLALRNCLMLGQ